MNSTINGLSRADVIKQIEADFPANLIKYDNDNHPYFPATAYQTRLNEIISIFNYDFTVSPHKIISFKDKHYVTVVGTLTLKYDDGTPALVREAEGGSEIIIIKATGMPKELTNDIKMAATDAFKACCRKLGMAEKQLQKLKNSRQSSGGNSNNQQNSRPAQNNNQQNTKQSRNNNQAPEEAYRVVITGQFEQLNNGGFKAPAKDVQSNEVVSLVFWSDAVQKVEEKMSMNDFCKAYVNKALSVMAQKSTYNSKNGPETTLTVRGFASAA